MQTRDAPSSLRPSALDLRPSLAWHGLHLPLPPEWSPVKIDGDWTKGVIVLADLHMTRLAIRWQTVPEKRFDPAAVTLAAIANEVGQMMLERSIDYAPAEAWTGGRLFEEPDPPGRDVWVGVHPASERIVELIYQTQKRDRVLRGLLDGLGSQARDGPQTWSIFDLGCVVPPGWRLATQRLHAGDLTLTFARGREMLIVRQVGPATLALARLPLERWLESQQQIWKKLYRVSGAIARCVDDAPTPTAVRSDSTVVRTIRRRRRFAFLRWVAEARHTIVHHDVRRDRLVLVDAPTRALATTILDTVGMLPVC